MKVIFLDIDGVLVNRRSFFIRRDDLPTADAGCVEALNNIIRATGARIVISSTWRLEASADELGRILHQWGVDADVMGVTPVVDNVKPDEIKAWIRAHPELLETFIIIDDLADMRDLSDRLVVTNPDLGLTKADVARAVQLLTPDYVTGPKSSI